jgi:hypothetical protein
MSKLLPLAPAADPLHPRVYSDDLESAIQDTLLALTDVEMAYRERLAAIDRWAGLEGRKKRLRAEVETLHQKDRQQLVLRLADLHYRKTRLTMFRTLH